MVRFPKTNKHDMQCVYTIMHTFLTFLCLLTHWGRATHICVGKLTVIGSDNGLSPGRRQAITWTNAGILLIRPWGPNFSEIFTANQIFSFKKMHLKMSSAKWYPVYRGLSVLIWIFIYIRWSFKCHWVSHTMMQLKTIIHLYQTVLYFPHTQATV